LFKFNASIGNIKLSDLLEEHKEWIITSKHLGLINEMRLNNIKFTENDILTALETKDENTIALVCTFLME
jgi:hypothetical protein